LLEDDCQLLTLLFELTDVLLESLILQFLLLKGFLELTDNGSLLLDLKNVNINFVSELHNFLLILNDLLVSVDHNQGIRVHFLVKCCLIVEQKFECSHFLLHQSFQLKNLLFLNDATFENLLVVNN